MRKLDKEDIVNEGWSVQIFSGDRRLLCSLEPSHGWVFLLGFILGGLVAAVSLGGGDRTPPPSPPPQPATEVPSSID